MTRHRLHRRHEQAVDKLERAAFLVSENKKYGAPVLAKMERDLIAARTSLLRLENEMSREAQRGRDPELDAINKEIDRWQVL